jgi:hypothetical protein
MKKGIKLLLLATICLFISSNIFAQNKKTTIDRQQFVGNYNVKMNIEGDVSVFYTNVSIAKGKLKFVVNEGGSMNSYYEEISVKEIKTNIEYHFKAKDLDNSENNRVYRFKKKGNRFELTFDY